MNRFPVILGTILSLGLLLTACVPIDGNPTDPAPSAPSDAQVDESKSPIAALPLQEYSTDGLQERIAGLSRASAAYQLQQGARPIDGATPESEQVLLAEHFSTSSSFALPQDASGNWLRVEVECSTKNNYRIKVFYSDGRMMANGGGTECSPDRPYVMESGSDADLGPEQVQVIVDEESDMQLSIIAYTREEEK